MKKGIVLLAERSTMPSCVIGWGEGYLKKLAEQEELGRPRNFLTEEMLSWPVFSCGCYTPEIITRKEDGLEKAYWNLLEALLNLDDFTSTFSAYSDRDNKRIIILGGNENGAIFYDNKLVVNFSTPIDSSNPFTRVTEWPSEFSSDTVQSWSADEWGKFFRDSIKKAAEDGIRKAHDDLDFFQNVRFEINHQKKDAPQ